MLVLLYRRPPHAAGSDPLRSWLDPETGRWHAAGKNLEAEPSPTIITSGLAAHTQEMYLLVDLEPEDLERLPQIAAWLWRTWR